MEMINTKIGIAVAARAIAHILVGYSATTIAPQIAAPATTQPTHGHGTAIKEKSLRSEKRKR